MGKFFRRRYKQLLGDGTYSPDTIYASSSSYDRTIASASLVLAGLFPPTGHEVWNINLLWQPIPVHVPTENGYLLVVEKVCARFDEALREHASSTEVKELLESHHQLFEYLEAHVGTPMRTIEHLKDLHNVLEVELETNKTYELIFFECYPSMRSKYRLRKYFLDFRNGLKKFLYLEATWNI